MGRSPLYNNISRAGAEAGGRSSDQTVNDSIEKDTEFNAAFMPKSGEDRRKKKRTRLIWVIIFIVVNAGVIIYTAIHDFSGQRPVPLGYKFEFSNVMLIIAGLACMLLALGLEVFKYIVMMRSVKEKVSFKTAFETAALGKYYDCVTPSGVGGQPFQIYHMHKAGYTTGSSVAMPLTSFVFMQLAFIFLAILTFIFKGGVVDTLAIRIPAFIGVVCYSIVPFFIIFFSISDTLAKRVVAFLIRVGGRLKIVKNVEDTTSSIITSLEEYRRSLKMLATKRFLILKLFGLSFVYQLAMCSIPFFVLYAFHGNGTFLDILAMTVFIYCAITIVPTPGNSGAAEGSFYLVFSGLDSSGLFWAMLIWRFICYYSFIVLGIMIYGSNAVSKHIKQRKAKTDVRP